MIGIIICWSVFGPQIVETPILTGAGNAGNCLPKPEAAASRSVVMVAHGGGTSRAAKFWSKSFVKDMPPEPRFQSVNYLLGEKVYLMKSPVRYLGKARMPAAVFVRLGRSL